MYNAWSQTRKDIAAVKGSNKSLLERKIYEGLSNIVLIFYYVDICPVTII